MEEIWKTAPGWEGRVEVSNLGQARTLDYLAPSRRILQPTQLRKGRVLKPDIGSHGYYIIKLKTGGNSQKRILHRLVALAFVEGHFDGATVDHLNGNKLDNRAENLDWCSRRENTRRQNEAGRGAGRGNRNKQTKLRDEDILVVMEKRAAGLSQQQVANAFGVSASLISKVERGLRRAI